MEHVEQELRALWLAATPENIKMTHARALKVADAYVAEGGDVSEVMRGYLEGIGRILLFQQDMQRRKKRGMVEM